jgi:hypothetical protein
MMNKVTKAFIFKNGGGVNSLVVTNKSSISNTKDEDYEAVTLIIPVQTIKEWNEEIELMGLDDEEEEDE